MPSPETIKKALAAIKRAADYEYFFDQLKSPDWIRPLWDAGMFRSPPEPIREGQYIRFPFWPESRYLVRMATRAPETVLEVALQIPPTENVRVHEDLVDVALQMPAALGARLVPKVKKWIELPYQMALPEKLGTLVEHLAKGSQIEAALDLAKALLAVLPDPRATEKAADERPYRLPLEPRARFNVWDYQEVLEKNVPELVSVAGEKALTLLCDLLDSAIRLSQRSEEDTGPEDYSYIWRSAIEDHEQNHLSGLRDFLVTAVRDAAKQIARADSSQVPLLVEKLEQRWWHVFQRIALHLLRVFPDTAPRLVTERLLNPNLLDAVWCQNEYRHLLKKCFSLLSSEEGDRWLDLIEKGPPTNAVATEAGESLSPEEAEREALAWRREQLAPVLDSLPASWRSRHKEWVKDLATSTDFSPVSISWGSYGPTSPKSTEDLRSMGMDDLVSFLRTWQWSGDPMISPEGLGRELTALVASEPERFAVHAGRFQGLDPTYVRAFLSGLRDAAKEKRPFSWPPLLELCRWVVQQPRETPGRKSQYADLDPGWVWARKTSASLLSAGFESGPAEIPFDLRRIAWDVLKPITDDPEPTRDYEAQYGGSNLDPATLSINTTRGEAMHAVVRYTLWVRRHLGNEPDGKERLERGLEEIPETREVLESHLDLQQDPSFAIRSVYGRWFPWLVLLDRKWAVANVPRIFPHDESLRDLLNAAWETYIIFCEPYSNVFDVLYDEYKHAIGRLGTGGAQRRHLANPEERLAEHLMLLYWRGKLVLDEPDGLLTQFYAKALDALCGHALSTGGRHLYKTKGAIPSESLARLIALWKQRLNVAQADASPSSHAAELAAFGWWFASAKFDDTWALDQLTQVLNLRPSEIVPRMRGVDHLVAERLAKLVENNPRQVVRCLRLMVEGDVEGWRIRSWREHVRTILDTARQNPDMETRQAAEDLVHRLGARGHFDFRDLLQNIPTS